MKSSSIVMHYSFHPLLPASTPSSGQDFDHVPELEAWFEKNWDTAVNRVRARGIFLDPEQLVLDAVVTAWVGHQRSGKDFETLLARRLYYDPISAYRRDAKRLPTVPLLETHFDTRDEAGQDVWQQCELRWRIATALRHLAPRVRRLVWLHFRRRLSHAEIARRPDLHGRTATEAAVKSCVSRAYAQMRPFLVELTRDGEEATFLPEGRPIDRGRHTINRDSSPHTSTSLTRACRATSPA